MTKVIDHEKEFDREMMRSSFVGLILSVLKSKSKQEGFTRSDLAARLGKNPPEISRWLNGTPNWTLNTLSDLSEALEVDLQITARIRSTGEVHTPFGPEKDPSPRSRVVYIDRTTTMPKNRVKTTNCPYVETELGQVQC